VIGLRTSIASGTHIQGSIVMGNDYYGGDVGIGQNCDIQSAILDKNVCIRDGVVIQPFPRGTDIDSENYFVRDGIVVVPKDAILPAGARIAPT
jgi:glucose-1-phosphate adenylyltransferase